MADRPLNRTLVIALAALVVAAILGYWGYGAYQARESSRAIAAALGDVSARLRDALETPGNPATAERARGLEEHLAATDRQLAELKRLDASRVRPLADAADSYLVTAREILKRQSDRERSRLQLAESLPALHAHMRSDNRSGAWVRQAVAARERVNRDYRGYQLAAETADRLLESLGPARKALAPHVEPAALLADELVAGARKSMAEDSQRVAAEMEQVRRIAAPR